MTQRPWGPVRVLGGSIERIECVQAGSAGLLVRVHGAGPGPCSTPVHLVLRADGRCVTPLPDGGAPAEPDTWRVAFAVPADAAGQVHQLVIGEEAPVPLRVDHPLSPAATARIAELEAELEASRRRRELGEQERVDLQRRLYEAEEQLARLGAAMHEVRRRTAAESALAHDAQLRCEELEGEVEELRAAARRRAAAERRAAARAAPVQVPVQVPEEEPAEADPQPEPETPPVVSSRPRLGRAGPLAAAVAIATMAALVVQGSGSDERPGGDAVAAVKPLQGEAGRPLGLYDRLYRRAARRYGLDWRVLAAIGEIESRHGDKRLPGVMGGTNGSGAAGPMQFTAGTWEAFGYDASADGRVDVYDPRDAIPAAASFLRAHGAPQDWHRALAAYNHGAGYADAVLARARERR